MEAFDCADEKGGEQVVGRVALINRLLDCVALHCTDCTAPDCTAPDSTASGTAADGSLKKYLGY